MAFVLTLLIVLAFGPFSGVERRGDAGGLEEKEERNNLDKGESQGSNGEPNEVWEGCVEFLAEDSVLDIPNVIRHLERPP